MKNSASIEWLAGPGGVLRVHPHDGVYGDDYSWCCTVESTGDIAILHGVLTAPTPSQFRAIRAALRDTGFKIARWIRMADGEINEINWEL